MANEVEIDSQIDFFSFDDEENDEDYVDESIDSQDDDDISYESEDYSNRSIDENLEETDVINFSVNRGGCTHYKLRIIKKDAISGDFHQEGKKKDCRKKSKKSTSFAVLFITMIAAGAFIGLTYLPQEMDSEGGDDDGNDRNITYVQSTTQISKDAYNVQAASDLTADMSEEGNTAQPTLDRDVQSVLDLTPEITEDMITREALVVAARTDPKKLAPMLRIKPQSILDVDENGWNLLHESARGGHVDCVAAILDVLESFSQDLSKEAYLNSQTSNDGPNALFFARIYGHDDVYKLLRSQGAVESDEENEDNMVIEERIFTYGDAAFASHKDPSWLQEILTKQPEMVDEVDNAGWNLLQEAARSGNLESVLIILQVKNDAEFVNHKNNAGGTALFLAKFSGNQDVVDLLKSNGAVDTEEDNDANRGVLDVPNSPTKDMDNQTEEDKEEVSEEEVEIEASDVVEITERQPEKEEIAEDTMESQAEKKQIEEGKHMSEMESEPIGDELNPGIRAEESEQHLEDELKENMENEYDVTMPISKRSEEVIVEYTNVNANDKQIAGKQLVEEEMNEHEEISEMNSELEKDSVENEEEVEVIYTHVDAVIAARENPQLLRKILQKRPELTFATDENGWTLIHEASREGNINSVAILLDFIDDAYDINVRTFYGGNAVWYAKQFGQFDLVDFLLDRGGIELPPLGGHESNQIRRSEL